jgi:hypothetical protein
MKMRSTVLTVGFGVSDTLQPRACRLLQGEPKFDAAVEICIGNSR